MIALRRSGMATSALSDGMPLVAAQAVHRFMMTVLFGGEGPLCVAGAYRTGRRDQPQGSCVWSK